MYTKREDGGGGGNFCGKGTIFAIDSVCVGT